MSNRTVMASNVNRAPSPGPSGRRYSYMDLGGSPSLPSLPGIPANAGFSNGLTMAGYNGNGPNNYYQNYGTGGSIYSSPMIGNGNFNTNSLAGYNTSPSGLPMPPTIPSFDGNGSGSPLMHRRDSFGAGIGRRGSVSSVGYGNAAQSAAEYAASSSNYAAIAAAYGSQSGGLSMGRPSYPPPASINTSLNSAPGLSPVSPSQPVTPTQPGAKPQRTTRTYRKKTPPEACAVCSTGQTPEWRKGPSGLRTLCNACGLTAAKQMPQREAETIDEVWQQLTDIGMNRFRGNFILTEERRNAAYISWKAAKGSGQVARVGNRASAYVPPLPLAQMRERPESMIIPRNPGDLEGAQALFSMSRGRGAGFSDEATTHNHPYSQLQGMDTRGDYGVTNPNPPTMPTSDASSYGRRGSISAANPTGRMAISGLLNQEPPSRPSSAASNRSTKSRSGYGFPR